MNYIKFLKSIFHLQGKNVEWGLIEEITYPKEKNIWGLTEPTGKQDVEYKPGLYIKNSRVLYFLSLPIVIPNEDNQKSSAKVTKIIQMSQI